MPRYYFDVYNKGLTARDDEGEEFDGPNEAMRAAARSAAEIGTNEVVNSDPDGVVVVVEVRDEQSQRVCSITAAMTIDWDASRP